MLIFKSIFGSRLYGTFSENSDWDFKKIYIPCLEDVILGNFKKSTHESTKVGEGKNSADDIETETYSIQYFLKLLLEGQTVALDLIHAKNEIESPEWDELYQNRHRFYTKKMEAFIGYAMHQSAKYGIKFSRIHAVRQFLDAIKNVEKLSDAKIEEGEHCKFVVMDSMPQQPAVEIVGKMFALNTKSSQVIPCLEKFLQEYGKRALMAENNEGIDKKSIHHAYRSCFEVQEICETGDLKYPLRDMKKLMDIKTGNVDFKIWREDLENEIEKTKEMLAKSNFPDESDKRWADDYLLRLYGI